MKKTLLEDYRAKKQAPGGKISAITGKETEPEPEARPTPRSFKPALILAELHGHRFACRIAFSADTIVKYLGDKRFFLPTMLPTSGKHFKAVDGHGIQCLGKCKSVRS